MNYRPISITTALSNFLEILSSSIQLFCFLPIQKYRLALYVNQLLTYKKCALRRITGLSLPTYKFYRHSRFKTTLFEERKKQHGWTKVPSEGAYHLIIVLKITSNEMSQTGGLKKSSKPTFSKISEIPEKIHCGQCFLENF